MTMPVHDSSATLEATWLEGLVATLLHELESVHHLRDALQQQRRGLAAHATDEIEASVHAMGRVMLTLEELKRRRGELLLARCGDAGFPLAGLESVISIPLPPELIAARRALRRAAEEVSFEIAVNHRVLRHSIELGETFLQSLLTTGLGPGATYGPGEPRSDAPPRAGILTNRRA